MKHSKRELTAKIRLQEHRILHRIAKTREMGLPVPRLEEIVERFGLDSFEKGVILLLIGEYCVLYEFHYLLFLPHPQS
ncbi:hypothetical protein EON65_51275 [archaeon]|nr:MAG: hypothetical protein EON65_51275 [archaeon]